MFKVILEINNKEYKGKGDTIVEAIDDTGLSFHEVKTKGTITIQHGKYEIEKFFLARQLKRLFNDSMIRKFWTRDMGKMFEIMKEKKLLKKQITL